MKYINGWYFPNTEEHFEQFLTKRNINEYQKETRISSFKFLRNSRIAIDIGANVGLWSKDICKKFEHAHLFEPYDKNVECLKKNLSLNKNYTIHKCALSNKEEMGYLYFNDKSLGGSSLNPKGFSEFKKKKIRKKILDNYKFKNVDYVKIDVQFHELEVIEGSLETLKINSPVVCIEAARRNNQELDYVKKFVNILNNINYKIVGGIGKELFFKKIS